MTRDGRGRWCKLTGDYWWNPKLRDAGLEATGLYSMMLSWSADHLTDGAVPDVVVTQLCKTPRRAKKLAARLTEARLVRREDEMWVIPDWGEHNRTAAEWETERKARAEAGRKGGKASGHARRGKQT